jgi:hypothetical protein
MLIGRMDSKRAYRFAPLGEHSPSEFQNADAWPSIADALECAWWTDGCLWCLHAGPLRVEIEVHAAD